MDNREGGRGLKRLFDSISITLADADGGAGGGVSNWCIGIRQLRAELTIFAC